jgi:hypothetical protein
LKNKYPFIKDFVFFSIKNDSDDLQNFRETTSEFVLNHPMWNNQLIPESYYKVRNDLEMLFQTSGKEYIDKTELEIIAGEYKISESKEQETLFESLHRLGICLWYKDEFNSIILNPNWLSNGIYKAINWAANLSEYKIHLKNFVDIFKDEDEKERYPADKFRDIFKLMNKHELAYSEGGSIDSIIVPHLLNEDRPSKLPDLANDSLMIKYISEIKLPPNIVCRLIVKHHKEISSDSEVWRYGVVLKYRTSTTATVIEDDRTVTITVKGDRLEQEEYISKLRKSMDDIFANYKLNKPTLHYRVILDKHFDDNPILLPHKTIKAHAETGKEYLDPHQRMFVNLDKTAKIFNITTHVYQAPVVNADDIVVNIFNFRDCNADLQGDTQSLIDSLVENGNNAEAQKFVSLLSKLKETENLNSVSDVKKSGLLSKLTNLLEEAGDENSSLCKVIEGVDFGRKTINKIVGKYNTLAKWTGLPQVHPLIEGLLKV